MTNRFQGDPKIYLTQDGANIKFVGGQPVMDSGVENQAIISLFGGDDWWGNSLIDDNNQKLNSDFEEKSSGAITLKKLNETEQSAKKNLDSPVFGKKTISVSNPENNRIDIDITIQSPGSDSKTLILSRNGLNWINQANNPAYLR